MASGTPVLTTNLPGMPKEYKTYVYLINDESVPGMAAVFKQILSLSSEELRQKGCTAKAFVLENKNNIVQTKKLIELLNRIF